MQLAGRAPSIAHSRGALLINTALAGLLACSSSPRQASQTDGDGGRPRSGIVTDDGLALHFDPQRQRFTGWSVAGATPGSGWNHQMPAPMSDASPALGLALSDHRGAPLLDPTSDVVREASPASRSLRIVRERPDTGVRVIESWRAHPRYVELSATIALTTPATDKSSSRAIEACLALPLAGTGKLWHHHLHESELIAADGSYRTLLTPAIDIGHHSPDGTGSHLKTSLPINLHGLNAITDSDAGLAIAMHPESPGSYYVAYDGAEQRLRACFHLSIFAGHRTRPDRTSLRLVLMRIDQPDFGLRSALAEYTDIFAPWFRGRLPRQTGMTVGGGYRYNTYPRPADFHIAGMWNAFRPKNQPNRVQNLLYAWPTGYLERGLSLHARLTDGPCADCDRSIEAHVSACMQLYEDLESGAVRFPQTCADSWAQRDCRASALQPTEDKLYGPVRIRNYFYNLAPYRVTEPTTRALRLLGTFAVLDPLRRSILRGPDGRQDGALSDSMGLLPVPGMKDIYTCYANGYNPDPGVLVSAPEGPGEPTVTTENFGHLNLEIAKRATGVYGDQYLGRRPRGLARFDGVALDTVGAYLRPDYNPEMLAVASHPLAYDPNSGQPVALEHLGLSAFIAELRAQLPDRVSIAINGYPISGTLGQGVDHFVRELVRRRRKEPGDTRPRYYYELYDEDFALRLRRIHRARMVAAQRPITFWARFVHTEKRAKERGVDADQALLTDMRALLPLYTATGIYVFIQKTGIKDRPRFLGNRQDPELMRAYRRHLDTVHALTRAGWQPVPHARAVPGAGPDRSGSGSSARLLIERFGGAAAGDDTLLTLYNPDEREARITLAIDWANISHGRNLLALRDWYTREDIPRVDDADNTALLRVELTIPAHSVRVLMLKPS